jgi:hypothetical protein
MCKLPNLVLCQIMPTTLDTDTASLLYKDVPSAHGAVRISTVIVDLGDRNIPRLEKCECRSLAGCSILLRHGDAILYLRNDLEAIF